MRREKNQAPPDALKPGALLLFDISSRYKLECQLGCNTFAEDEGENAYIWKNCYDAQTKLIEMNLSFFTRKGGGYTRFCERHVQRAHSQTEMEHALREAGFDTEVFAAFTREPPVLQTERIQFVARKMP